MPAQDQAVSDIMIVVDSKFDDRLSALINTLKSAGLRVGDVNEDEGVIEGTIQSSRIAQLHKLDGVDYVRTVFTYIDHQPDATR